MPSRDLEQNVSEYAVIDAATHQASMELHRGIGAFEHTKVGVEADSVYGMAILMPQLAQSVNWSWHFTSQAIASYVFLVICVFLHGGMLTYLAKEQKVMDHFAGQPALCDFGRNIDSCTGDTCMGPGGTKMTWPRLYDWNQWVTRSFVRDSLKKLFPDMADKVDVIADPGEYGLESEVCRYMCVFIFVIGIMSEVQLCVDLLKLLWYVPTMNEPWIELVDAGDAPEMTGQRSAEQRPSIFETGGSEYRRVKIKVAGMSFRWKSLSIVLVVIPKCVLVYITASAGVCFLMETSSIDDLIVNAMALGFLLNIDEVICVSLMSEAALKFLHECEDLSVPKDEIENSVADSWKFYSKTRYACQVFYDLFLHQLARLWGVVLVSLVFITQYFLVHCEVIDGRWASKPIYVPQDGFTFSPLNAFLGLFFPIDVKDKPVWKMANEK